MKIDMQYAVRTFFPNTSFRQVFLEAVANAFDAGATEIDINIDSDGEINPKDLSITVRDNGQGFTDERFAHFERLQEPKDVYHKGLGRLVYLQYFTNVHVNSAFAGGRRKFVFTDQFNGESEVTPAEENGVRETVLQFSGFRKERLRSYDDIKPAALKRALLEEFLPQLYGKKLNGDSFAISISLRTAIERAQWDFFSSATTLTPSDVPAFTSMEVEDPELGAFATTTMSYVVYHEAGDGDVRTLASIDGRTVHLPLLKHQPLPAGKAAIFLFESDLFAGQSDGARQRLVLPENLPQEVLFRVLKRNVASVLATEFPEIEKRNHETRAHFEERYPHLVGLFESETVGVIDREEAVKIAQAKFFAKQRDVLEGSARDDRVFVESLELSSRTLAEYVLYRDFVIKRLADTPAEAKEQVVHNLIVPQYRRFEGDELMDGIYANNAWILDDKFMTFRTILSEAKMQEVVDAITIDSDDVQDDGRPDISFIFSADPSHGQQVDVVIVEVKRRAADDKEGPYATTQLLKRARKLVKHCPNIQRMWYFGIIELDDEISSLLEIQKWQPLFSKGTVYYQEFSVEGRPTPVYLMSWKAVVEDAEARNRTFLEILKRDIKEQTAKASFRDADSPQADSSASAA
jgi:hypothetical protein